MGNFFDKRESARGIDKYWDPRDNKRAREIRAGLQHRLPAVLVSIVTDFAEWAWEERQIAFWYACIDYEDAHNWDRYPLARHDMAREMIQWMRRHRGISNYTVAACSEVPLGGFKKWLVTPQSFVRLGNLVVRALEEPLHETLLMEMDQEEEEHV